MPGIDELRYVWPELKADCARCTGLCCVAYPFIDADKFGYDKPADQACRHLGPDCRCAIHDEREQMGFRGCITFDCNGAGQRAVNDLFRHVDWRTGGVAAGEILDAFRALTHIHAALAQLKVMEELPLDAGQLERFQALFSRLEPASAWTVETLDAFPAQRAEKEVQVFAVSLQGTAAGDALAAKLSGSLD